MTSKSVAKKASRLLKKSPSFRVREVAASALAQRRKKKRTAKRVCRRR